MYINLIKLLTLILIIIYGSIAWLTHIQADNLSFSENDPADPALAETQQTQTDPEPRKTPPEPLRLAFVGDIMLDRGVRQMAEIHGRGEYSYITQYLDFLQDFDLVFGNLEGPLSDQGRDLGGKYSFRMTPAALPVLTETNFSVLSVANNHAGDWGRDAFEDTLERLAAAGIQAVGGGVDLSTATEPAVIEIKETVIGFLGFTDLGPRWLEAGAQQAGILWADSTYHDEIIEQAAEQVDWLVVSYHYGKEYQPEPNSRQIELARRAIDLGADIVAGHHPHVIQPVELYNDGVIAYSLGNFIFDQYFSPETMEGLVLVVEIEAGELTAETLELELTEHFQPRLRAKPKYPNLIRPPTVIPSSLE